MTDTLLFLLLMIPGTFFLGVNDILVRKVLRDQKTNEQLLIAYDYLTVAILIFIPLLITGLPELKSGFWGAIMATTGLNIFAIWAWFTAFKKEEASLISPLRLLTPPFVIITGYLILREQPTAGGIIGILVTVLGLWLLLRSEASFNKLKLVQVVKRPGVLLGICGALSFAVSLPFDKKAVITSSSFLTIVLLFAGVGFGNALIGYLLHFRTQKLRFNFKDNWRTLLIMPFVHTAASALSFTALNYALVAYAGSVKRLWSFWAVLLSGKFLKEQNIGKKLLATAIMLIGVALTVFLG